MGPLLVSCALLTPIGGGNVEAHPHYAINFSEEVLYRIGGGASCMEVSDFDGDGDKDLAIGNFDRGTLTILVNDGLGAFPDTRTLRGAVGLTDLGIADFDRDGRPDIVTLIDGVLDNAVALHLNRGGLEFDEPTTRGLPGLEANPGAYPKSLALPDLNGDRYPDLAVAYNSATFATGGVSILMNQGGGLFSSSVEVARGKLEVTGPNAIVAGDFDADGDDEVVAAKAFPDLVWVRQDASGLLLSGTIETALSNGGSSGNPLTMKSLDFDLDGDKDVLFSTGGNGRVIFLRNDGDGEFDAPIVVDQASYFPEAIAFGDFDGNGTPDLAVNSSSLIPLFGGTTISFSLNNGTGSCTPSDRPLELEFGVFPEEMLAPDVDGDGDDDLLVLDRLNGTLRIFYNWKVPPNRFSADRNDDDEVDGLDLFEIGKSWRVGGSK